MNTVRCWVIPILLNVAGLVLGTMAVAETPAAPPAADDRATSVGRWRVVAVEWNGSARHRFSVQVEGTSFAWTHDGWSDDEE